MRYVGVTAVTSIGCPQHEFNGPIILLADDRWYYFALGRGSTSLSLSKTTGTIDLVMPLSDNFESWALVG
jgi:hypothetical protein